MGTSSRSLPGAEDLLPPPFPLPNCEPTVDGVSPSIREASESHSLSSQRLVGSHPKQPWKGGGRGSGSPLTRAFAGSKPPLPPAPHSTSGPKHPGPYLRRRTTAEVPNPSAACSCLAHSPANYTTSSTTLRPNCNNKPDGRLIQMVLSVSEGSIVKVPHGWRDINKKHHPSVYTLLWACSVEPQEDNLFVCSGSTKGATCSIGIGIVDGTCLKAVMLYGVHYGVELRDWNHLCGYHCRLGVVAPSYKDGTFCFKVELPTNLPLKAPNLSPLPSVSCFALKSWLLHVARRFPDYIVHDPKRLMYVVAGDASQSMSVIVNIGMSYAVEVTNNKVRVRQKTREF
ncbi:hypothetical protein BU15DRAFT_66507 [Melanogaster broomeanus]|nr:hypothetical protein BU15DRAFT_66507 [Melanogaster broomeanus]